MKLAPMNLQYYDALSGIVRRTATPSKGRAFSSQQSSVAGSVLPPPATVLTKPAMPATTSAAQTSSYAPPSAAAQVATAPVNYAVPASSAAVAKPAPTVQDVAASAVRAGASAKTVEKVIANAQSLSPEKRAEATDFYNKMAEKTPEERAKAAAFMVAAAEQTRQSTFNGPAPTLADIMRVATGDNVTSQDGWFTNEEMQKFPEIYNSEGGAVKLRDIVAKMIASTPAQRNQFRTFLKALADQQAAKKASLRNTALSRVARFPTPIKR